LAVPIGVCWGMRSSPPSDEIERLVKERVVAIVSAAVAPVIAQCNRLLFLISRVNERVAAIEERLGVDAPPGSSMSG
jgi:hypothetical protein